MEFNIKTRLAHAWNALVNEEIRIKCSWKKCREHQKNRYGGITCKK